MLVQICSYAALLLFAVSIFTYIREGHYKSYLKNDLELNDLDIHEMTTTSNVTAQDAEKMEHFYQKYYGKIVMCYFLSKTSGISSLVIGVVGLFL